MFLRSTGCTSFSVRATLKSPHSTRCLPACLERRRPRVELAQEHHLRVEVLAAVRDVDRAEHGGADLGDDDPVLVIERRVDELRWLRKRRLAQHQRDAGVAAAAVPVRVIARDRCERLGHLVERRLDLLQADDVGNLAVDPVRDLRGSRTDAVDVPGRDLHAGGCV